MGMVALAGCKPAGQRGVPADTTRPRPAPVAVDSLRPDSLLAVARSRQFDTLRGRTDEQVLMSADGGAGPRAEVAPEVGAFRATRQMLAAGYVVGRIVNRDSLAYPAVNLAPRDTVYWFVDSAAAGWRATFVSSQPGVKPLSRPMRFEEHADQRHLEPSARWLVAASGTAQPWITCTEGGCCTPD